MAGDRYSLAEVLTVAKLHPFYDSEIQYPPKTEILQANLQKSVKNNANADLHSQPLLHKKAMYEAIERLIKDVSAENTYRHASYMTITGGGSGGIPMMFAVDVHENRKQRALFGRLLRVCGIIEQGDVVLSTHIAGNFYCSLDLTTETMENAGATVLSAGNAMSRDEIFQALVNYRVNVLTADGSQCIRLVTHIAQLPKTQRDQLCLNKIIYTSEPLTGPQREFIRSKLGDIKICSVMGSSEAGPWAINNPELTGEPGSSSTLDFVFDARDMLIEILPPSVLEDNSTAAAMPLPDNEPGIIVQTSLQRLRNPLARYITGDVGSLHDPPERAGAILPETERKHLRVLRMQGRDKRFSFKWFGPYFDFSNIEALMNAKDGGILQWQIIHDHRECTMEAVLEIRLLRAPQDKGIISDQALIKRFKDFFSILDENKDLFRVLFMPT
ncbi:hypothetical protein AJ79_02445 [Helicocarpus griseus UAMH5409]|uniref:AMP-dependent synthetase/ligase domain-containing protein n=1 Tax=Helicocarpus griseus UAMH5409 TaxID=1447875 RepID=A0A2B7Y3R6_9EURO|nr:hypothetical protein AJ79_02445 [Helicocarpus griseus UAMH5409]